MVPERAVSRASAAGILLVLAMGCSRERDPLEKLLPAIGESGIRLRGRIAGAPEPRVVARVTRGTSDRTFLLRAAANEVLADERLRASSRTADLHAIGVSQWMDGHPDRAIEILRTVTQRNDALARDWNDLAAALLEQGAAENDPRLLGEALASADRALELNATMAEASYNRIVALDELGLEKSAAQAAHAYLHRDTASRWATSLRQRLIELETLTLAEQWKSALIELETASRNRDMLTVTSTVSTFPQQARAWAEGEFLGQWADAFLRDDQRTAADHLQLVRDVATALRNDKLLSDIAADLDRSSPVRMREIATAFVAYRNGRKLFATRRITDSLEPLRQSEERFRSIGSPLSRLAAYYRSNALMDADDLDGAAKALDRAEFEIPDRYASLRAMCAWQRGNLLIRRGDLYDALLVSRRSMDTFIRLGETGHATRMRNSIATTLTLLGRTNDAWRLRHDAIRDAVRSGDRFLIDLTFNGAARQAIREQQWAIARALLDAALADQIGSPRIRVDLMLWRAFADARMHGSDVPANVDDARRGAEGLEDPKLREEALDWIRFAEAITLREREPSVAVERLTTVIDWRRQNGRHAEIVAPYVERARALRRLSRDADALADLREAIEIIESNRTEVATADIRDSFFGSAHDTFDELIDLHVARRDFASAFAVSEQKRARVVLDRVTSDRSAVALRLDSVAPPKGIQILHFTTLQHATLLTIFDDRGTRQLLLRATRAELEKSRDNLLAAIRLDGNALNDHARHLYDLLLGNPRVRHGAQLVIVPDDALLAIPFGALIDERGRFLIEDSSIVIAPSAATYVRQSANRHSSEITSALIVADPAFDASRFSDLPRLEGAQREARQIARLLPGATVLTNGEATAVRLKAHARGRDVIHIAAHALTNPRNPSASFLILAPDDDHDGLVNLSEILGLHLDARLVVLAGCETASLSEASGDLRSLAMGFLATGSESVAASLWDVGDDSTADLTGAFYRHFAARHSPAEALRLAQLDMLRSADTQKRAVRAWAALQMYGTGL